nr:MAG TPA: hypothetical protein [Caudoviricetes sp.]
MAANAISIFLSGVFTVAPQNIFDDIIVDIIRSIIAIHNEDQVLIHRWHFTAQFVSIDPCLAAFVLNRTVQQGAFVVVQVKTGNHIISSDHASQDVTTIQTRLVINDACSGGTCSGNRQGKYCGHQKDSGDCHYHGTGGLLQRFQNGFHNDVPHDVSFLDSDSNSGACYSCIA